MHLILCFTIIGDNRMACLMEGRNLLVPIGNLAGFLLRAGDHFNGSSFNILLSNRLTVIFGCQQGRFVEEVFKVCPCEACCCPGNFIQIDIKAQRLVAGVYPKDFLPALDIRIADHNLAVEASGTQQRRVQYIPPVGRRDDDDAFVLAKAVHFNQQLVQGLLPFIVPAAKPCAALTSYSVNLVNKDDRRGVFLCRSKQVAHAGSTNAHEHLHKIRTRDGVERDARFTSNRPCQQGFTGTGRAHQQHPFGDPRPQ